MSTPTRKPFLSDEEIRPRLSCGALHFAKGDTRRPVKAMTAEQIRDKYEAHLAKREALIQLLGEALLTAEQYMTSTKPAVGPGCVCHCPVIDGHTGACKVIDAIKAYWEAGFTPTPTDHE